MGERAPRARITREHAHAAEPGPAAVAATIAARRGIGALAGRAAPQVRAAVRSGTSASAARRGAQAQPAGRRGAPAQPATRRARGEERARRRSAAHTAETAERAGSVEAADGAGARATRAGARGDEAAARSTRGGASEQAASGALATVATETAATDEAVAGHGAAEQDHAGGRGGAVADGTGAAGGHADAEPVMSERQGGRAGVESAQGDSASGGVGSDAAAHVQEEAEVAREVTDAQSERTPTVGAEPDPLAPVAQHHAAFVNADAARASAQVVGRAAARRAGLSAHFATRRAQVTALVHAASDYIGVTVTTTAFQITASVIDRLAAIQTRITQAVAHVTSVIAAVSASIQNAANVVIAAVSGLVSATVARVMDFAETLPIPDLPLIGRVRGVVLGAARRIAGVITSVVTDVGAFAASIVGFVLTGIAGLASQFGALLLLLLSQLVAAVLNVIGRIQAQFTALRRRIEAQLRVGLRAIQWVLILAEQAAIGQIDRMERSALQRIEANRRRALVELATVLAFVVGGPDYPSDDGTWGPLDALDSAVTRAVADAGALAAFAAVAETARVHNALVLARFELQTSNLVSLTFRGVADFARDIVAQVGGAVSEVVAAVAATAASIYLTIRGYVASVIAQVVALGQLIASHVRRILNVFGILIGNPLDALRSVLLTVVSVVRGFVTRLIDGLISFFRRGTGSDDAATQGVTSALGAFSPARLAAAAGMASVPLGIGVILAEAAGATLAILGAILFWTAIAGIVILSLYVLYRLAEWIVSRVRARPIARAVPKEKAQPKERAKRRRRRRVRKLFFWNPRANSGKALTSGGMAGALDVRLIRDHSTPQGHHVWPKYVGGPELQPMLGARLLAHQALHREFPLMMGPAAASLAPPPTPLTPTTVGNLPLISKLRNNDAALTQFTAALTGFYVAFNAQVDPRMPVAAYLPGIVTSVGVIRSWRRRGP